MGHYTFVRVQAAVPSSASRHCACFSAKLALASSFRTGGPSSSVVGPHVAQSHHQHAISDGPPSRRRLQHRPPCSSYYGKANSDGRQVAIHLAMADAALPSSADLSVPKLNPALDEREEDEYQRGNAPLKYISLCDVYSATSPCVASRGSKKVKAAARKPPQMNGHDQFKQPHPIAVNPTLTHVYYRRRTRKEREPSFFEAFVHKLEELEADAGEHLERRIKRRKKGSDEGLGDNRLDNIAQNDVSKSNISLSDSTEKNISSIVRKNKNTVSKISHCENRKRKMDVSESDLQNSVAPGTKNWVWLNFEGVDPEKFIGLHCKVYWPLDASWYSGHIVGYNPKTGRHHVKYEDEEEENLILSNERIKFHVSFEDTQRLKLKSHNKKPDSDGIDVNEMMALAASLDDCQEIETGDVIWAKLTGHAVWPAIVLDESQVGQRKGLKKLSSEKSVLVQFFGTHDFARVMRKQVISFLKGLVSSCHSKCKKPTFVRGLEEAKMFLTEHRLPKRMLQLRDGVDTDMGDGKSKDAEDDEGSGDDKCMSHEEISKKLLDLKRCPLEEGDLHIISLGKFVKDTCNFQDEKLKWPEGYTAVRMFPSITDPSVNALYKMEVLRDVDLRLRPLFRVTADNGEEFSGPTPSTCWNNIYKRIRTAQIRNGDYKADQSFASGSFMFGFSHSKVSKLIKEMSRSRSSLKSLQLESRKSKHDGYREVHVAWRDLDKCNVCHMDEEYENNLFLQCDKCRMMVHARCYGELEPTGGILWLCNLCRPGAPESPPPCCLCPIVGGAMKPTTDGRWAHLACAIWIPETCLFDVKKMEPIDGLSRINKDRWKLLCSICGVPHGACIQCSNNNCRVAYHPLCARVAGFCLEPEDKDRLHLIPFDEDEEDQCIQLLSFCKKHRPSSNERLPFDEQFGQKTSEKVEFIPPINPSGCARTEPLIFSKRRGRYDPEVPSASFKRLYVENQLYLIGGCSPRMPLWNATSSDKFGGSKYSTHLQKLQILQLEPSGKILSLADKYNYMRDTFRKRLAIGKSGIHGFGVFTKVPHRAGDMVIEYIGEIIRAPVADRREHLIYNSLVGAGTYMFRIDDERVIDATRAGSIAHLINHSCEPNCYSRVILVNGDDHIIIFAKRDIKQWEELTYDYRFLSTDERLVCSCGSSRCRGIVNDIEAEERVSKLYVSPSELQDWQGE
ncbi:Histone-lysine N-methyltransferase ATX2 [Striga hermonthica]|uniref:Histone-lysine N-methyltransferase ATX2 n=1 Tax=Striga hermonthica TaxID=68872 RepID=A0A9N7N3S2_STRHE|nr:Histone-lysine N-methyltransferase ATX2 [Striga hermonthica]